MQALARKQNWPYSKVQYVPSIAVRRVLPNPTGDCSLPKASAPYPLDRSIPSAAEGTGTVPEEGTAPDQTLKISSDRVREVLLKNKEKK